MLIYLEAPFAAFRTFTAGWYRPSAAFLTPSAAYGLLMNLAGVETRLREGEEGHDGKTPATLTRSGLPPVRIALGTPTVNHRGERIPEDRLFPRAASTFQQLHNYPVGASGKERAASCYGNKYNITPVRRELLSDVRAVVKVDAEPATLDLIRRGLSDDPPPRTYGVPFLGDNAFLLDRCEVWKTPGPVRWFEKVTEAENGPRDRTTRLTERIDRADLSKTVSHLFAPSEPHTEPPAAAWVRIESPQVPVAVAKPKPARKGTTA